MKNNTCQHEHLCCPGGIKTVRCAYCGESMYKEPGERCECDCNNKYCKHYKSDFDKYLEENPTPSEPIKLAEIDGLNVIDPQGYVYPQHERMVVDKVQELIDWSHKVNKILKGK